VKYNGRQRQISDHSIITQHILYTKSIVQSKIQMQPFNSTSW